MGRKRERVAPLTRWQYFTKTLYSDAASRAEFEYDRVIYFKSEELQRIEAGNRRIHGLLLVILCLVFLSAIRWQNIYFVVACMAIIVAGEAVRLLRLPKDIRAHLTDTGRGK